MLEALHLLIEKFSALLDKIEKLVDAQLKQPVPVPGPDPVIPPAPTPKPHTVPSDGSTNFFEGLHTSDLYVPKSSIAHYVEANPTDPDNVWLKQIADTPMSVWLTRADPIVLYTQVTSTLKEAAGKLVTFTIYLFPNRDQGGPSAGGAADKDAYEKCIGAIEQAVHDAGDPRVVFFVEPDALNFAQQRQNYEGYSAIQIAVDILKQNPNRSIYISLAMWNADPKTDEDIITFLTTQDRMSGHRGYLLNPSGYASDNDCRIFGDKLCEAVGGHYVVDTSRNGRPTAPPGQWENVRDMGLGSKPLTQNKTPLFDGNVWVKIPGESDGPNNGAPNAGEFYKEIAVELAKNAI